MTEQVKSSAEDNVLVGIPTMALLPPKNFYFKVKEDRHKITVPKSGKFSDLDKEFYSEADGNFSIVGNDPNVINISIITKVLFGTCKYPLLKDNQLFCPISIVVNEDTVDIFGQIVDMLEAPLDMTVDK
jgi:hypothetical protein